ncbi:MAG: hypothetical protein ABUL62_34290 [Myxococcales bacterium]
MKTLIAALVSSCALFALTPGCAVDSSNAQEDVAQGEEEALCSNDNGVNSVMAALAVATGREIRRWLPNHDFQWNARTGRLELTYFGNGRISNKDTSNVKALLAMQDAPPHSVQMPGGVWLDPAALRAALKANWDDQVRCEANGTCHPEADDLVYSHTEFGSCGVKAFFDVYRSYSTKKITDAPSLNHLNDNLTFLGFPENRMLNFYLRDGRVSVDPTVGLTEGGTTMSGSCTASCTMYSATRATGECCLCNGVTRTFSRSPFSASMYLCR